MEPILRVMPGKLEKAGHAGTSIRGQDVEKCRLASRDVSPSSSPASKRAVERVETLEQTENSEEGDNVDYAESVASECSLESDASSNTPEDDCGDDAVSPAFEDINMKRCASGGSIVTYDEAGSKLREDGECERTRDRKTVRRPEGSLSNGFNDEQETSINAGQKMAESTGPAWTDDKHYSYLNSIEQTFVQSLYGQDYHTVDASGQDDQDCVESRPMYGTPYGCELFTSLQRGCYDQREYYKPQILHTFGPSPSVFLSPWIQHFNPRVATPGHGSVGAGQDAEACNPATGFVDGAHSAGNFGSGDVKEEVKESIPNLNNPDPGSQVPLSWSSRYQSQHHASTSAHARADTGIQAKKRNVDPGNDGAYRPKKLKTTQRWLAEMDVELDEQFVLKQKSLKEEHQQPGGVNRCFDLNQELVDEEETTHDVPAQTTPEGVPRTTDFVPIFREPTMISNKGSVCEESLKKTNDSKFDIFLNQPPEGDFGEGTSGGNKFLNATAYNAPPGVLFKTRQDEANSSHQADSGFDEDEDFEFLRRRSPRASKTYTWGGVGPRRRVHNECNVSVAAAALPGSVKDARDHELPNKGSCD